MKFQKIISQEGGQIGDDHYSNLAVTPLKEDAFERSGDENIKLIQEKVIDILKILEMDLTDDNPKGNPNRATKMYVREIFGGLKPDKMPKTSTCSNNYQYGEMLVEKNMTLYSTCEYYLLPIVGKAHIAYISNSSVVGLSKMNRIVDYFGKRPHVQERLTLQIVQ